MEKECEGDNVLEKSKPLIHHHTLDENCVAPCCEAIKV